jgi:hypothetical protein
MNAPGWQPDPTTRHEYRYWDGSQWTDDVSDGGVTSVDPVDGSGAAAGASGFPSSDATSRMDPATQAYGSQVGAPPPGGAQGPGSYGGYGADPYAPSYGGSGGGMPPGPAPKKGPNPALIVAIVAIVILALGGGAFALMSGGDDDDDPQAGTTTTTAADSTTTTAGTEDTTTTTAEDTTDTSTDTGDTANEDTIVPLIAEGIQESAPELTDEQAECIAQVIVDEVGVEQLMQMGIEGNPDDAFNQLTPEQQASLATSMLDCAPADVLAGAGA